MKLLSIFLFFFIVVSYNAQTIIPCEAGAGKLKSAISSASPGDVVELITSGGVYTDGSSAIDITKSITVRAQSGLAEKPILRSTSTSSTHQIFQIKEGSEKVIFTVQGVIFDGEYPNSATPCKYGFRTYTSGNINCSIKFEDCEFKNVSACAMKIYHTSIVDSLIISNCIFTNIAQETILLREGDDSYPTVNYVEITNSTFFNVGREALYAQLTNPTTAVMKINHCTFDDISNNGTDNKRFINPVDIENVEIKNSLFTNQQGSDSLSIILYGNSTIHHCDIWNARPVGLNGNAAIGEGMLAVNPEYTNSAMWNFLLLPTSPVLGKADDGKAMGDLRWAGTSVSVADEQNVPNSFNLSQNYPNPFNPTTVINYSIPESGNVILKIYDLLGREVAVLVNQFQNQGVYNLKLSSDKYQLTSGIYFYSLQAGNLVSTKKMILLK